MTTIDYELVNNKKVSYCHEIFEKFEWDEDFCRLLYVMKIKTVALKYHYFS